MLLIAEGGTNASPEDVVREAIALCAALDALDTSRLGRKKTSFGMIWVKDSSRHPCTMQLTIRSRTVEVTATSDFNVLMAELGTPQSTSVSTSV
jgi:hypothetical protein